MSNQFEFSRKRFSENLHKKLRKLYSQTNSTQQELKKFPSSLDHKDNIIKDSTSFISNNQSYTHDEISKAYNFLCDNSKEGVVNIKSLVSFLEEQGESLYTGVEMISLLDKKNKGFVSMEEFFNFFEGKFQQTRSSQVPEEFRKEQQLVEAIQKDKDGLLRNFEDPEYCEYASKQIKKYKYSEKL